LYCDWLPLFDVQFKLLLVYTRKRRVSGSSLFIRLRFCEHRTNQQKPAHSCCRSGHMGLQPSSTQLSHLLAAARGSGELKQLPCMALRYAQLAAERGIASAAAALAYAYKTGTLCASLCDKGSCYCI
jgi:hypothetical protein